jgi:isoquinoline 1-oxidoreductase subunit beta
MPDASVNRRDFLRASSVGGISLLVGFYLGVPAGAAAADDKPGAPFTPNGWIRIDRTGDITVLIEKSEIGQGIFTALSTIVAEELEADWSHIRVEHVPVTDAYRNMTTGGSGGVLGSWMPLRRAGAQAREMLITAASKTWAVKRETCRAENSTVIHQPTGRRLTYGALVESAVQLPELNLETVKLKDPRDFRLVGKRAERKDLPAKINGAARFGIDVKIPGMLYAVVARCPHFGGQLLKFDVTLARAVPTVVDIFPIDPLPRYENTAGGVVVVAESTWAAIQARKKLEIQWDKGPRGNESSASLREAAQAQRLHLPRCVVMPGISRE